LEQYLEIKYSDANFQWKTRDKRQRSCSRANISPNNVSSNNQSGITRGLSSRIFLLPIVHGQDDKKTYYFSAT
jgi:hypothetical protein